MKRTLLSNFKPTLQIQVYISSLFELQKKISSFSDTSELIRSEIASSFWNEDQGILHQLQLQVKNMSKVYPVEKINQALNLAISACEASEATCFASLFQLTAEFIQQCEPDENLYYFLLRHQEDCKKTFGRLFLFNLLSRNGLETTEQFLHDKYHERGFFHLKTVISAHLEGLKQC